MCGVSNSIVYLACRKVSFRLNKYVEGKLTIRRLIYFWAQDEISAPLKSVEISALLKAGLSLTHIYKQYRDLREKTLINAAGVELLKA